MNRKILYLIIGLTLIIPIQSQASTEVTLDWSTNTYTPIGYPGRAMPSQGSVVEVVANVNTANPQELIYTWSLNYRVQGSKSGQGKQVFRFNIGENIFQDHLIKADVKDAQGNLIASSDYLTLRPHKPEIVLESNKTQFSSNQEAKFTAQPYFFNINRPSDLNYQWNLGNRTALQDSKENPHIFTLKIGEIAKSIIQNLNIWAENKNNPIQRAQSLVKINLIP